MALGELLLEACAGAKDRLTLCAPFIKVGVIHRILEVTDSKVEIEVFTRWRPDEVAAGVSDTEILPLIGDHGGEVFLCDRLHAKYVRVDDRALIGSANLTAAALGWRASSNLELLVEVSPELPEIVELDAVLRTESIAATPEIAAEIDRVASLLPTPPLEPPEPAPELEEASAAPWYPQLREPRDLFVAYSDPAQQLSRASAQAATADLAALEIPPSLEREPFEELVATRLLQAPLIRALDGLLEEPQRFGAVRNFLGELLDLDRKQADHAWQTLMRWLLYFMSDRYARSVPSYSEILSLRDQGAEVR